MGPATCAKPVKITKGSLGHCMQSADNSEPPRKVQPLTPSCSKAP
jgi:hypothetical protein